MAPAIGFYAGGLDSNIHEFGSSGLGFYGPGFGLSVEVGDYQDTTFVTDSNGTAEGPQINNVQYLSAESGIINSASSGVPLTAIPNYLSTLNIRFTNDVPVTIQNPKLRIFDRIDIDNSASGVTTKVAEIIHVGNTQVDNGSGDVTWTSFSQATPGQEKDMLNVSPGESGLAVSGPDTLDDRHDWYCAISASPDSIGSKNQYGLYFSLEYLD